MSHWVHVVSFVLAAAGKEQLVGTAAATNHSTASPTVMRLFNAQKPRVSAALPDLIRLHWIVSLDQEGEQRFWKSEHVIHHSKLNHPNPQTNPQTPATTCNNDLKSPVKLHSLREVSWFFFPKAAAKGSFKKSAVIKHCYQTLPKVLLK